ncbi:MULTISPECIES: hypothetical protein [unclassified Clostridium]|uniref:hypothetical protein n=1 Tax=unclassified Clostridium TaxID=2614128 RepID=UPI0025BBF48C|nr:MULTISPECIES: hypothetical protein [unclassified Clostridium]
MGRRKPSMFSKNYEKQMRKRRRRYVMLILASVAAVIVIVFSSPIKQSLLNIKDTIILNKDNKNKDNKDEKSETATNNNKEDNKDKIDNKSEEENLKEEANKQKTLQEEKEIKLSDNATVKLVIENKNNDKRIISINNAENTTSDISPSGKQAVFEEKKEQRIFLMNVNGDLKEITKKEYVSTENEIFSKESVLQYTPGYLWGSNPKFVDEKNIAYISYLPWINEDKNQYVWMMNLQNLEHTAYYNLTGKDIKFGKIEEKGLIINIDGKVNFLKGEGNIVY